MDIEEVDTASMPKKQKVERGQQLVQVKRGQEKWHVKKKNLVREQQQEEPKIVELQIQEYVFDRKSPSKNASKEDWLGSYRERDDKTFKEIQTLKKKLKKPAT